MKDEDPITTPRPHVVESGPKNAFQIDVDNMRQRLPYLIEYVALSAKMRRAAYLAYISEGFTEKEALELCKGH